MSRLPAELAPLFTPPDDYRGDFGSYKSLLEFYDGRPVKTAADWPARRGEILDAWRGIMGAWPPVKEAPAVEVVSEERREPFTQRKLRLDVAVDEPWVGYLLVPDEIPARSQTVQTARQEPRPPSSSRGADPFAGGRAPREPGSPNDPDDLNGRASCRAGDDVAKRPLAPAARRGEPGPFPAVLVPFYDAETGAGLAGKEYRDFGRQLTKRGFVSLSIGLDPWPFRGIQRVGTQPLSALGWVAANCLHALANMPEVDPARIGIVGHSYGGKWAMFAACLYETFACGVWSDPGIAFDETRPNVNYWEPWYLGFEPGRARERGIPTPENPRTGAYETLVERGHDLHELQALMAPRPFLVSGGAEDQPERWQPLNRVREVYDLLDAPGRVGMTNREHHSPNAESNEVIYRFFEHWLGNASEFRL
ncbi:MAG: hypothetical protein JXR37_32495 [Kiritimatiellae bacterium]|nr:hypothetical protein [Kiritimatiellia bacterium]